MTRMDGQPEERMDIFDVPEFWPGIGNRDRGQTVDRDQWLEQQLAALQEGFLAEANAKGYDGTTTWLYRLIVTLRKASNGDWSQPIPPV